MPGVGTFVGLFIWTFVARALYLRLSIEDDGQGFGKTGVAAERHGLANMQQRLRDLGGELEIESAAGQGTRVHARVRLPGK